jgi:amino acid adenylation domain-containing protein
MSSSLTSGAAQDQDQVRSTAAPEESTPPLQPYGLGRSDPSVNTARLWESAGPTRTSSLRALAESDRFRGASPSRGQVIALATAWVAFLHRVTGNRELLLALPLPDRATGEIHLPIVLEERDTFAALAERIRSEAQAAWGDGRAAEAPRPNRTRLTFAAMPGPLAADGDGRDTLGLVVASDAGGQLELGLDFHEATFPERARARARTHFLRMLDALLADVDTPIDAVDLLDEDERAHVLAAARGPEPPGLPQGPVERLAAEAQRHPDRVAVVAPDGILTYAQLDARSNQMARRLRAMGIVPGSRVGVAVPRGVGELLSLLAILKAGGAYVPIDPLHPADRVRVILEDAHLHALLAATQSPLLAVVPPGTTTCRFEDLASESNAFEPAPLESEGVEPEPIAYVLFTSGSTGRPKGVEVLRSAFANFLRSMAHTPGLGPDDRLLAVTTTTFDIAGLELFLPLYVGATLLVADRETAMDPRRLRARLEEDNVTVLQATPATWRLLVDEGWQGDRRLRMLCGGEALSRDLARKLLDRGAELWNVYGPTETTVWSTVERIRADDRITIGRPIDHTQVVVLDGALRPVPVGVSGEIYIAGKGLARGYLDRPELTAERFLADPFELDGPGSRLYRTGDLGRLLEDGRFECLGRIDHQVKIRGFRIELADIEAALRLGPGVNDAVVIADTKEPGDPRLLAYFTGDADRVALFEHARGKLPPYMIPSAFVQLAAFPLTTSGKVDRKALPSARPITTESASGRPPRDAFETSFANIWAQVLRVPSVGMDDNLFGLGATSVLIVRARARLEAELGLDIPLRAFFEHPTLDGLLSQVSKPGTASGGVFSGLYRIRLGDGRMPMFLVHGDGADRFLPALLPKEQSIYGYLHQGADGKRMRLTSVEALAARCHAEWLEVCRDAPCAIVGHSYGGLVAWEVARLRRQAGLPVAVLAMIDTVHPVTERRKRTVDLLRRPKRWYRQMLKDLGFGLDVMRALRSLRKNDVIPVDLRNPYIFASYELGGPRYRTPNLDVDVLLFRSEQHTAGDDDLWHRNTSGRTEIVSVPGDHLGIVREEALFRPIGESLRDKMTLLRG